MYMQRRQGFLNRNGNIEGGWLSVFKIATFFVFYALFPIVEIVSLLEMLLRNEYEKSNIKTRKLFTMISGVD